MKTRWSAKRAAKAWRDAEHKAFMDSPIGVSDEDCERVAQEHLVKARLDAILDAARVAVGGRVAVETYLVSETERLAKKKSGR